AAVPDGDTKDFVDRAGSGFVVRPDDSSAMASVIERLVDGGSQSGDLTDRRDFVMEFEYRNLTQRVAHVFDRVVNLDAAARDVQRVPEFRARRKAGGTSAGSRRRRKVAHIAYYFPPIAGARAQL